ncbi:MAG: hypothetical protein IPF68_11590 [Bacteroidales bacterium]|nr:hypothetical protein [Bacteroidales bacterium]
MKSHTWPEIKGTVFASTWSNGLFTINTYAKGEYSIESLGRFSEKDVSHLYVDPENNLWIAADIGIILLQETLFGVPFILLPMLTSSTSAADRRMWFILLMVVLFLRQRQVPGFLQRIFTTNTVVLQVIPDKNGLWLADADGAVTYTTFTGKVIKRFDFSAQGRAVFKMVKDRDGSIWACQDVNTSIIRILPDFTTRFYGLGEGLLSRAIALTISGSGELYAGGMTDSSFLMVYNPYIDKFINLSERIEFERNIDINVNDIVCAPRSNDIWLGTSFGLIWLHKEVTTGWTWEV